METDEDELAKRRERDDERKAKTGAQAIKDSKRERERRETTKILFFLIYAISHAG